MSDRIDETITGGYYIGTDGVPHDAHGRPIAMAQPESSAAETGGVQVNVSGPEKQPEPKPEPAKKKGRGGK